VSKKDNGSNTSQKSHIVFSTRVLILIVYTNNLNYDNPLERLSV